MGPKKIFARLWQDECGAILTAEYLLLGALVVMGVSSGLASLRDGANAELENMGGAIRSIREQYGADYTLPLQNPKAQTPQPQPAQPPAL